MVQSRKSGEIVAGGERMTGKSALDNFDLSRGSFYPPTVITDVDTTDEIWQEEIFGPVVIVKKFCVSSSPTVRGYLINGGPSQEEEEGVMLANACKYGLGAGIWSSDLSRAHRVADAIEAGLVWVNTHHRNDPSSPWYVFMKRGVYLG